MTRDELLAQIYAGLESVAPGCNPQAADPDDDVHDALDIDSMDFLNFIILMHKSLHVDIPESDYPKLLTLNGIADYLLERLK